MTTCELCGKDRETKKVKMDDGSPGNVCEECMDSCCEGCEE